MQVDNLSKRKMALIIIKVGVVKILAILKKDYYPLETCPTILKERK
jgi:hypothetical protein